LQAQLGDKRQHRAIHDTPVHVQQQLDVRLYALGDFLGAAKAWGKRGNKEHNACQLACTLVAQNMKEVSMAYSRHPVDPDSHHAED